MQLRPLVAVLMAIPVALGLSAAPLSAAPRPATVSNPCERLTAGEVQFPTHGADRVTFATAKAYGDIEVLITGCVHADGGYVQEWQTSGFAGRAGFAPPGKMWQDTLYSPTGSFTFTEAFGRANPGTALKYHTLNRNSRWGGERGPKYNQYFEGEGGDADENLWFYMREGDYEQAAVINWNREPDMPTVQGASFAIFLHAGNSPTLGCISTGLSTVTRLLKSAKPGDRIVMGVEPAVFKAGTKTTPAPAAGGADGAGKTQDPQPAILELQPRTIAAAAGAVALLTGVFLLVRRRKHP